MIHRELIFADQTGAFADDVLNCGKLIYEKFNPNHLLGINIFLRADSDEEYFEKKKIVRNLFDTVLKGVPAGVIAQSPDGEMAAEVWLGEDAELVEYKTVGDFSLTLCTDSFGQWLLALGMASDEAGISLADQSAMAFEQMKSVLSAVDFSMDDVIRQWNYIPDILRTENRDKNTVQHYQIFNDVRQKYYTSEKKNNEYPAATGIGMSVGNVAIDFLAVKTRPEVKCTGVSNPRQINAFDYNAHLLVGTSPEKKTPLFARARYLGNRAEAVTFVSGTASILGEETHCIGNIALQTNTTIENIDQLVSRENLKETTGTDVINVHYRFNRVYVKHSGDIEMVKDLCNKYYGDIPALYVQADICRDNLLVEIESEIEVNV